MKSCCHTFSLKQFVYAETAALAAIDIQVIHLSISLCSKTAARKKIFTKIAKGVLLKKINFNTFLSFFHHNT